MACASGAMDADGDAWDEPHEYGCGGLFGPAASVVFDKATFSPCGPIISGAFQPGRLEGMPGHVRCSR